MTSISIYFQLLRKLVKKPCTTLGYEILIAVIYAPLSNLEFI
jgi:hypothetical protein